VAAPPRPFRPILRPPPSPPEHRGKNSRRHDKHRTMFPPRAVGAVLTQGGVWGGLGGPEDNTYMFLTTLPVSPLGFPFSWFWFPERRGRRPLGSQRQGKMPARVRGRACFRMTGGALIWRPRRAALFLSRRPRQLPTVPPPPSGCPDRPGVPPPFVAPSRPKGRRIGKSAPDGGAKPRPPFPSIFPLGSPLLVALPSLFFPILAILFV